MGARLPAVPEPVDDADPAKPRPAALVVLAGWVLPGLGYWVIGERARALWAGGAILALFVGGLLVAGVRTLDPPGYVAGEAVMLRQDGGRVWALRARPLPTLLQKPAYLGQVLVGPAALAGTWGSLAAARAGVGRTSAKLEAPAALGTAIAGMLNLMAIVDAAARAGRPGREAA